MFQLTMLVEDKKLAKAMKSLDGLVYDLKVLPVKNAQVKNGNVKQKHPAAGATDTVRALVKAAKDAGKFVITRADLCSEVAKAGYHPNSASIGIKLLIEKGALLKHQRGIYNINVEKF